MLYLCMVKMLTLCSASDFSPFKKDGKKNERDRKERYICRKGVKEDVLGFRKTVQEVFFSWGEGGGQMG